MCESSVRGTMRFMEDRENHDIVIIGGGAAGLRAALEAAELRPDIRVAIVSKVYPTRSHTVSAEGGLAAVIKKNDDLDQHCYDTIKGSDYLADQDAVEFFVKECKKEVMQLEHWGCPWSREDDGTIAVRAFGGMSRKRTVFAADKTGFYMLHSLFERTLQHTNIVRYDEWYVTKILTNDQGISGVVAIQQKTGEMQSIGAKAVIVATGGAGKLYGFTTNSAIKTGDGMALAFNSGAALKDMEFIQFHPTALPKTGILITEGARGEGGYLLNNKKERFLKDYVPEKMELAPRDLITRAIVQEIKEGRGFNGPYGSYVQLDIRHLGEKMIDEKLPLVREVAKEYGNVDPVYDPIPVKPAQHYIMGGIHTNVHGETTVPGLYAAGETACISINGANRLGSNSLSECLVFGAAAAKAAVENLSQKKTTPHAAQLKDEEKKRTEFLQHVGKEKISVIRSEMEGIMDQYAGVIREEKGLMHGLNEIKQLQERSKNISLNDKGKIFNTELINLYELRGMLVLCETVLTSALKRRESRGAHYRSDFPTRDDKNFLKHFLVVTSENGMQLRDREVAITRWQPEERKY